MLRILLPVIYLFFTITCIAQNCNHDSTGLIPINDLEGDSYLGYPGGLYSGTNIKPAEHIANLHLKIAEITPMDLDGSVDSVTGKIVMLSIGASNPKTEFDQFIKLADSYTGLNSYLKIVNGCKGASSLQKISDPEDSYWKYVAQQLDQDYVNEKQVQVIWLEEENTQVRNYSFPEAPLSLMEEFKVVFQILLDKFPNLKLCYLNGRGYAGYIDSSSTAGNGLRFPRDYYQGWAMKWLIEHQIKGDSTLAFSGPDPKAPLLDWGAYLWADGKQSRRDGLAWLCPEDVSGDGLHWTPAGNIKAGQQLFNLFSTDTEARLWFTESSVSLQASNSYQPIKIYPNPSSGNFMIDLGSEEKAIVIIYNSLGKVVQVINDYTSASKIESTLSMGIYFIHIRTDNAYESVSKILIVD